MVAKTRGYRLKHCVCVEIADYRQRNVVWDVIVFVVTANTLNRCGLNCLYRPDCASGVIGLLRIHVIRRRTVQISVRCIESRAQLFEYRFFLCLEIFAGEICVEHHLLVPFECGVEIDRRRRYFERSVVVPGMAVEISTAACDPFSDFVFREFFCSAEQQQVFQVMRVTGEIQRLCAVPDVGAPGACH